MAVDNTDNSIYSFKGEKVFGNHMKKTVIAACATVASLSLLLAGCGTDSSSGKTQIRFATWDVAEDVDRQQTLVDQFNESHDDIEVTLEAYGSDFDTKISAGMGSNDTPDVMYMWNYPSYADGLEPLDSYIEKEGSDWKSDFYSTLWNYNSYDGKTYGVPVGFTTHALYYNKQAGVEAPTNDWTWTDLQKAAKKISSKTDAKGFSFQMKPDPYDFEMYLWSNDTAYSDENGTLEGNIDSAKAIDTYQMFQDMEKDGSAVATEGNGTDEFRAGTTAMYIYGSWALNTLDEDGLNYGVVDIPAFADSDHDSVSILSSSGISIAKSSKNKDAAWEFIKYWANADSNKARIGSELPVLTSVVESEGITDKSQYKPFYSMLEQSDGYSPSSFKVKGWSEISDKLALSFEKMYNPSTLEDPASAITEALK